MLNKSIFDISVHIKYRNEIMRTKQNNKNENETPAKSIVTINKTNNTAASIQLRYKQPGLGFLSVFLIVQKDIFSIHLVLRSLA